jgi:hypothetical protein
VIQRLKTNPLMRGNIMEGYVGLGPTMGFLLGRLGGLLLGFLGLVTPFPALFIFPFCIFSF